MCGARADPWDSDRTLHAVESWSFSDFKSEALPCSAEQERGAARVLQ